MDWDWEDGPPSDTPPPRRTSDEPDAEPDLRQPEPPSESAEPEVPFDSAAQEPEPERLEDESPFQKPPPVDSAPEYVLPGRPGGPGAGEPPLPEFERPRVGTIEAAERALAEPRARDRDEYRPRSPEDRATARERRRRQLRLRRLVALAIVVAIIVLLVVLLIKGCGGSDSAAAAVAFGVIIVDRRLLVAPRRQ